jgi:hypothetical protein
MWLSSVVSYASRLDSDYTDRDHARYEVRRGPSWAARVAFGLAAGIALSGVFALPLAAREAAREARTYTELVTPHFTLLTMQDARQARAVAQRLWAFRLALESRLGVSLESSVPVSIFALEGEDWRRYAQPRSGLAGGFSAQPFAVDLMFDASAGDRHALELTLHEYTHHLLRALGIGPSRLPPFLDEGLAELLGSARFGARALRLAPRPDHLAQLDAAPWLPFDRVLEVGRRDAEYVEHAPARMFYAQAWGTAFFVLGSEDPRQPRLPAYVAALREIDPGLDAGARAVLQRRAAEALVGVPVARANEAIGRFLRGAGRGGELALALPRAALAPVPASVRRIGQDEYDVRLAELMLRLGNRATLARGLLRAVPAGSPLAPRARVGAALAVLQSGERPFAAALLDDPALEVGVDAATAVQLARGLLQLGLPSAAEVAASRGDAAADAGPVPGATSDGATMAAGLESAPVTGVRATGATAAASSMARGAGAAAGGTAEESALRLRRLERARALFAQAREAPGGGTEAAWGYVVATLALQRREPGLFDLAVEAYATAPGNPDLAVAVALVHEAEGRPAEAQRFWAEAVRNLRPGPERDRILGRMAHAGSAAHADTDADADRGAAPLPPAASPAESTR